MDYTYYAPTGGLPDQNTRARERAHFTNSYAVIPRGVLSDIVTSFLPGWENTRAWVLARPLSGFAETFAQLIVEVSPGGGAETPEPDPERDCLGAVDPFFPTVFVEVENRCRDRVRSGFWKVKLELLFDDRTQDRPFVYEHVIPSAVAIADKQ